MPPEPKTHWKTLVENRFIGSYALPNGMDLTTTIESVQTETICLEEDKPKLCRIMSLLGHKPMILNVTNSKTIQNLYGPYIEDWAGKQITLFASTTLLDGELVECLRIRPCIPSQTKMVLGNARLAKALTQIKAGQYTLLALRAKYALSAEQEAVIAFHMPEAT